MMRTIKVTGKGKIAVKPDMIRLFVNKEELCHKYEDLRDITDTVTVVWEIAQEIDCMLSSIYYGEIQSDKLVSWNENKDPYNILVENNRVYKLGGWEFLDIANKLFDNEKQVDWGSYAYQCTKEQLV